MITQKQRRPVVHYPVQLVNERYVGDLYGFYHSDSNEYNIVLNFKESACESVCIGHIENQSYNSSNNCDLFGYWEGDNIVFKKGDTVCVNSPYDLLLNIYSRNSGILETDLMLKKSVIISGLGSVGSLVALELARAGVGSFLLIDNDVLAYHNICRHQLGIKDVGKFKVSAVSQHLKNINPLVNVKECVGVIEDIEKVVFDDFITADTLIIGCADNREADLYANKISNLYKIPFVSIGFWERAFAGEIFYSIPGKTPCYGCVFGGQSNLLTRRSSKNRRFYTNEENLAETKFQPGISADINFITIIAVKMAVDLFNLSSEKYIPRLLNYLSQYTLICNTDAVAIAGEQVEIFSYPLQVTNSIKIDYDSDCCVCGGNQ